MDSISKIASTSGDIYVNVIAGALSGRRGVVCVIEAKMTMFV